ncbi:MAG: hypothetical protein HY825_02350 [Acidobacteria bacterium]|nr:hypothetical protein [Acidobacteriota bacterium]
MANTKKLPRQERKAKKRVARRTLKDKWAALTRKERQEFVKAEKPLTVWLREKAAEKAKAAEAPAKT